MNRICFILIFLSIVISGLQAQRTTSSPYSRYGLGNLEKRGFGQNIAMGGLSQGLRSISDINPGNPASYTSFYKQSFLFQIGVTSKFVDYKLNNFKQQDNNTNLSYIAIGFNISNRWSSSIGLVPFSSVGYKVKEIDSVYDNHGNNQLVQNEYIGEGGFNQVYWGNAIKIFRNLSVGLNAAFLFGSLDRNTNTLMDTLNYSSLLMVKNKTIIKDFTYTAGIQYHDTINKKLTFVLGATYDNKRDLKYKSTRFVNNLIYINQISVSDTLRNDTVPTVSLRYPQRIGFGFTLNSYKWSVGADYYLQDWTKTNLYGNYGKLVKSSGFSTGVELCPDRLSPKLYKAVRYRFGLFYNNTYLNIKDQQIKDMGISFGIGLPMKKSTSIINLSMELGRRGTTANGLLQENYGSFHVNFSMFDIWFRKRQYE